jgi:hypothetical protein
MWHCGRFPHFIEDFMSSFFPIWNCNIQKCTQESSLYFPWRTPFHLAVVYELSLNQYGSHMWDFDTRNNMAEWMFKYRSMSMELWSTDMWHINSLHSSCLTIYWGYTERNCNAHILLDFCLCIKSKSQQHELMWGMSLSLQLSDFRYFCLCVCVHCLQVSLFLYRVSGWKVSKIK